MDQRFVVRLVAPSAAFSKMNFRIKAADGVWANLLQGRMAVINRLPGLTHKDYERLQLLCTLTRTPVNNDKWVLMADGRTDDHPCLFYLNGITLKYLEWDNVPEHIKDEVILQCVEEAL